MLPGHPDAVWRNSEVGNRLFVEAVIWKSRSGAPWLDLPERFGGWKNVHTRLSRWAKKGVWESLFKALADDPDNETTNMPWSTPRLCARISIAPASPKNGGGEAIGRSRGGSCDDHGCLCARKHRQRRKRHEVVRYRMASGEGLRNDERRDLAAIPEGLPCAAGLNRAISRRFRPDLFRGGADLRSRERCEPARS